MGQCIQWFGASGRPSGLFSRLLVMLLLAVLSLGQCPGWAILPIERGLEHTRPEAIDASKPDAQNYDTQTTDAKTIQRPATDTQNLQQLTGTPGVLRLSPSPGKHIKSGHDKAPAPDAAPVQTDIYGVVLSVKEAGPAKSKTLLRMVAPDDDREHLQKVTVRLISEGPTPGFKDRVVTIDNVLGGNPAYNIPVKPGARVLINMEKNPNTGQWVFYIANRDRTPALIILGTLFLLAALLIGGIEVSKHLLLVALMLMGCYKALFPAILDGTTGPNWIMLMCFTFTILASFIYKVPGTRSFNREQSVVILGTTGGLVLLSLVMWIMHEIAPLNGFSSEGLASLWYLSAKMDYVSLLMGGALLGFQGFLFYLCWSLAQGRKESTPLAFRQRFDIVMRRGRRILGPLISSLGLLFLGLFMPILLQLQGTPTAQFINLESTVSVLALAFAGGLTLILTVPLTALIAAWLLTEAS